MHIYLVHDIDAPAAACDLIEHGMVGIDDITTQLIDGAEEEIMYELGHAADEIDLKRQQVNTAWGPVFVLRVPELVSAAQARAAV